MKLDILKQGYCKYLNSHHPNNAIKLKAGQHAKTVVVCCCDSRVDPAILFSTTLGDIFAIRSLAAMIPHYSNVKEKGSDIAAALEVAIAALEIENIIILGHSNCTGAQILEGNSAIAGQNEFSIKWRNTMTCNAKGDAFTKYSLIAQSYRNCISYPFIKKAVAAGLVIEQMFFDIAEAKLTI